MRVAIVHDYLTQRGGAERVVLSMARAFPGAPIYTSAYHPDGTFPEFSTLDVRPSVLDRVPGMRSHHRLGLPLYGPVFDRMKIDADVVLCSSSGWAHRIRTDGRLVVYCHNPARWLYQAEEYLQPGLSPTRVALRVLRRWLLHTDRAAAARADQYIVNASGVRERVRSAYGIDAVVLPPPPAITAATPQVAVPHVERGFHLVVSRLLPYKNVAAVIDAFRRLPGERLVIIGDGPLRGELAATAPRNVDLLGRRSDEEVAWAYENCAALVAASFEDYGLTPLEAASFGKPSVVLRRGGYLDTMTRDTATFFDDPDPEQIVGALEEARSVSWNEEAIRSHASRFGEGAFVRRLVKLVAR